MKISKEQDQSRTRKLKSYDFFLFLSNFYEVLSPRLNDLVKQIA